MNSPSAFDADVLIIGSGPAGLSAAVELRRLGVGRVVVVERESVGGGVPRHCHHMGFGLRDLHRSMTGPRYSAELVRRAVASGAELRLSTTATTLDPLGTVRLTSPRGIDDLRARAVLVASGARERPRSARLVAGDRPAGVFTTGQLQQWTYEKGLPVGSRAIVIGAEHVSFSAMLTLRHAGVRTAALCTELGHHQSVGAFALVTRSIYRVPIWTNTRLASIIGHSRVREVVLENLITGERRSASVDTVVFSGDWIPDHEFVRRAGTVMDVGTRGPTTDVAGRTSRAKLYAAGNLVHPVETADRAALGGRRVARELARDLATSPLDLNSHDISLRVEAPLQWVWPNRYRPNTALKVFSLRASSIDGRRIVCAHQDGQLLGSSRITKVMPNRSLSISTQFMAKARLGGGPVVLTLSASRT